MTGSSGTIYLNSMRMINGHGDLFLNKMVKLLLECKIPILCEILGLEEEQHLIKQNWDRSLIRKRFIPSKGR